MGLFKQESAYERRKRELDEEAERVRKNLQSLMKTVKKDIARPAASEFPSYDESAMESDMNSSVLLDDEPDNCIVTVDEDEDGFTEADSRPQEQSSSDALPPYGTARLRHFQNQQKQKENIAPYLASGSFGKRGPLTRERRIQRNKAIFMLILAVLAVFSLVSWLK